MPIILSAGKTLVFKEPMITLGDLLKRWIGIKPYELKKIINETIYYNKEDRKIVQRNISSLKGYMTAGDVTPLFRYSIHPYCIDKVLEKKVGEYLYCCRLANWATVESALKGLDFGYQVGFKVVEVEHYEEDHPEVRYKMKDLSSGTPEADNSIQESKTTQAGGAAGAGQTGGSDGLSINSKKYRKRSIISLRKAVQHFNNNDIQVSVSTVKNWCDGVGAPDGFPGLNNEAAFYQWVAQYKLTIPLRREARSINRAILVDPHKIESLHHKTPFLKKTKIDY